MLFKEDLQLELIKRNPKRLFGNFLNKGTRKEHASKLTLPCQ